MDHVDLNATAASNVVVNVVNTVNDYTGGVIDVPTGAVVKGVYISFNVGAVAGSAGSTSFDWYIWKNPSGTFTPPTPGVTGGDNKRRHILHEEKGIVNPQGASFMLFKGYIAIPKGRQRMGEQDILQIVYRSTLTNVSVCIKSIYKFFT